MEAPDKIKIGKHNITSDGDVVFGWVTNNPDCEAMQHDIEYVRADVFIEKAIKYIANHFLVPGMDNEIEDFVNYIKGE
jgi:hypothetical protein